MPIEVEFVGIPAARTDRALIGALPSQVSSRESGVSINRDRLWGMQDLVFLAGSYWDGVDCRNINELN